MLEKAFQLKQNNVTVRSEVTAGITTFMAMAYILAVNPQILSTTGMPADGVLIATALSSFVACVCMAFFSNMPFALAPGMGLNAYFAYVVAAKYGWRMALFAVFIEGIIFIILSLTNVREALFDAIPLSLKYAISGGIGLFIAFIGLVNANLVVKDDATLISLQNFRANFNTAGIGAILCMVGVILIAVLSHKKVRGAILIGIVVTWVLGIFSQALGIYIPDPEAGFYSLYPVFTAPSFSGVGEIFGQAFNIDFTNVNILDIAVVVFAFLFVDIFDTLGTVIGVASKADMLDEDGKMPKLKGILLADAIGTTFGAVAGTSTVTTFVESSAGVAEGGRTGLTALTTGSLFLLSIILAPLFIAIPAFATAAALLYVGFLMLSTILKIDFNNITEAVPAYIALISMPFFYSIAEGISFGIISYVFINLLTGNSKKISPLMYVLTIIFILRYLFLV
ncbi:MAG: NCS2 family permease [Clostridiaceae bacterium]|nr:NCS2 family permease [Clostridiaceae bacterium]